MIEQMELFEIDATFSVVPIDFASFAALSWTTLFPRGLSPEERRQRWERWKAEAIKSGDTAVVERWETTEACEGCKHLDGFCCKLQGLPCTVNPILTFRHGLIGMACMGAGYESVEA